MRTFNVQFSAAGRQDIQSHTSSENGITKRNQTVVVSLLVQRGPAVGSCGVNPKQIDLSVLRNGHAERASIAGTIGRNAGVHTHNRSIANQGGVVQIGPMRIPKF